MVTLIVASLDGAMARSCEYWSHPFSQTILMSLGPIIALMLWVVTWTAMPPDPSEGLVVT